MNNELLAKQHLEYAKNNLKLYLDNRNELNHKINKAQKDYEKKKDDQSFNKLNDLINEKRTLEYLFKIESTMTKALTTNKSILVECNQLDNDFRDQSLDENKIVIDKKQKILPIKKQIKKEIHEGQLIKTTLSDYVVLDLETTGLSAIKDKIIEVGILKVRDNIITETYEQLINPQKEISKTITELTGITNEMVANAPMIGEVKDDIREFIGSDAILGHNVTFDINFLKNIFDDFDNDYLDTLQYSRKAFHGIENNQLTTLVETFHLTNNQHRSLADCNATKELYDLIVNKFDGIENLYKSDKNDYQNKLDIHILNQVHINKENKLKGKNCIITGYLSKMSKRTGNEIIKQCGGTVQKSVNKKVNIVIIGRNPYGNKKTSKHIKAEEKKANGQEIEFVFENEFYEIIGLK